MSYISACPQAGRPPGAIPGLLLAAALTLIAAEVAGARAFKRGEPPPELPLHYRDWLEEVELLLDDEARAEFLSLENDTLRDVFIERFWRRLDPDPKTPGNPFRDRWSYRLEVARQRLGSISPKDQRVAFLLFNGWPDERYEITCGAYQGTEVWGYRPRERTRRFLPVIFYPSPRGRVAWDPYDTYKVLYDRYTDRKDCNFEILIEAIDRIKELNRQLDYYEWLGELGLPCVKGVSEKAVSKVHFAAELPPAAETFDATVLYRFPRHHEQRTVVEGTIAIAAAEVGEIELGTYRGYSFLLNGEVLRGNRVFDRFRSRFDLPASAVVDGALALVFEELLRPGDYRLKLRLEDVGSGRFFVHESEIRVPRRRR